VIFFQNARSGWALTNKPVIGLDGVSWISCVFLVLYGRDLAGDGDMLMID
jgi:hypothetical protein